MFPFCKWCIYKENPIYCLKWWCCSSTLHVHQNKPCPCRSSEASGVASVSIFFVVLTLWQLWQLTTALVSENTNIFSRLVATSFLCFYSFYLWRPTMVGQVTFWSWNLRNATALRGGTVLCGDIIVSWPSFIDQHLCPADNIFPMSKCS